MKLRLFLLALPAFATALVAFRLTERYNSRQQLAQLKKYKQENSIRCSPDWNALKEVLDEVDIPPIPGAGSYKWKISTNNDSAQFYFNQGINMYYGFHIIEAMASFKKAEKFDGNSAMIYWAKALAYGPNINDLGYAASPDALTAVNKAVELSGNCTPIEKALIVAQAVRYSADSTQTREHLNQLYADKMKALYEQHTSTADVAALYADALMLQHPWDLWFSNGTAKQWTPRIRTVLEKLLTTAPLHPGANHYYIHVMEPSPYAALATASANRLGSLTPALSHMVHMPSHIYLRTGNYSKGGRVNEDAVKSYKKVVQLFAPAAGADFLYVIHNLHMQANHAIMSGDMNYAIESAKQTAASIPADYLLMEGAMGNYLQYIYHTAVLVDVRYARWDALLAMTQPPAKQVYSNVLYHFGKGMAYAHQQKLPEAKREYDYLSMLLKDTTLSLPFAPFSPAIDGATVAANLLAGSMALAQTNNKAAIEHFSKAVTTEEQMVYNEPRDWLLNPKHYLGNAYLQQKDWNNAEKTLLNDLKNNNNNIWALSGLYTAYMQQSKTKEAAAVQQEIKKAGKNAVVKITAPVL
jgi:tetratricopeptide (TPR) repeat protein